MSRDPLLPIARRLSDLHPYARLHVEAERDPERIVGRVLAIGALVLVVLLVTGVIR